MISILGKTTKNVTIKNMAHASSWRLQSTGDVDKVLEALCRTLLTGNKELVLQANNATALTKMIKWASTTDSMVSAPASKPVNPTPAGGSGSAPVGDPFADSGNGSGAPLVLDMNTMGVRIAEPYLLLCAAPVKN